MQYLNRRFFVSGTTLGIEGDHSIAIVDPGWHTGSFEEVLKLSRDTKKQVTDVVLSHAHNDHMYNLMNYVPSFPGMRLIVSPNSPFAGGKNVETCFDGEVRRIADVDFTFMYTPGHSAKGDDISVHFAFDRFLFCGDLAQPQGESYECATYVSPVPFYHCGSDYLDSLDYLLAKDFRLLITGHGGILGEASGRNWLKVTKKTVERTQDIAKRLTSENPLKSDAEIADWVFNTIAYERAFGDTSKRLVRGTEREYSDYELYDLPGIINWVKLSRNLK
jgi:glyoxylase-like metal-dependent hydrolase (beta-lactamase superfamily II)